MSKQAVGTLVESEKGVNPPRVFLFPHNSRRMPKSRRFPATSECPHRLSSAPALQIGLEHWTVLRVRKLVSLPSVFCPFVPAAVKSMQLIFIENKGALVLSMGYRKARRLESRPAHDRSRDVAIPEGSGTASRKGPGFNAAHEVGYIFAPRISRVQVSGLVAAWGKLPERSSMLLPQTPLPPC